MHLALPLVIPWLAAVLLALLDGRRRNPAWFSVVALATTMASTGYLAWDVQQNGQVEMVTGGWPAGVGINLRADMMGVTFALLSLGVLLSALTFEVLSGVRSSTFPALVLFLATGLVGVFLTADAFNFYVFFEIAMIAAYVLTSYGEDRGQLSSATIFAVVNLLGSAFFLIGIASLYHVTGRLDMSGIAQRVALFEPDTILLSAVLIFIAFSIKLGIFPFHFWLPAVYTGTRPAVAAILSGAVANIGSYGLLRFGGQVLPHQLDLGAPVFMVLGVASIIYGSVQALSRRTINEVLAYSSIGQVGFILIALAIGGQEGIAAAVLFAIINAINKTLLFLSENLRGWLSAFVFLVGALSVAGLPPVGGYLGKAGLFRVAVLDENWLIVGLVVIGSALSFIYMFQAFQIHFWVPALETDEPHAPSPAPVRGLVASLAVFTILVGVWPEPALWISQQAAMSFGVLR